MSPLVVFAPLFVAAAMAVMHWQSFGGMVLAWWRLKYHRPHRLMRLLVLFDVVIAMFLGLLGSLLVRG